MMSEDIVIGIDLGTTNSCAAIVENGRPRVISDTGGSYLIPSVVAIDNKGNRLVGQHAKRQILINPKNTVYASKRLIGRPFFSQEVAKAKEYVKYQVLPAEGEEVVVKLRDEYYGLAEISALILDHVRNVSQERIGKEIHKAVVTVPAYFNDRQRQAVKKAGELAELEVLRIINEPTAAAIAYGFGKGLNQTIAVYDLGGGTFDISILEVRNNIFEVKATGGDTFLGGVDFDNRLVEWVFYHFEKQYGIDLSKDPIAHQRVQDACELAKIELSSMPQARIHIPYITMGDDGPINIDLTIKREEFEQLIEDLVDSTLKSCEKVLDDCKLRVEDIDAVLLVGGSSRVPLVARKVAEFFKKQPSKAIHPDEAVALGAAILADSLAGSKSQEIMLLDVLPINIGIKLGGDRVLTIFERNSPVPNQKKKIFTTSKDNQTSLHLTILQGDSSKASECVPIGDFKFTGLKPAPKGKSRVEVTFTISPEGVLSLSAIDPDTGAEQKSTIKVESSQTKIYHQKLVEPKKPVSTKQEEKVITRTVIRERKLKVPSQPEGEAKKKEQVQASQPKPTQPQATQKPAIQKPSPPASASPKKEEKEGLLKKLFSWFKRG